MSLCIVFPAVVWQLWDTKELEKVWFYSGERETSIVVERDFEGSFSGRENKLVHMLLAYQVYLHQLL